MTGIPHRVRADNANYELFIGLLTFVSFVIVLCIAILPSPEVVEVLRAADTLICAIFLIDVVRCLSWATDKRAYLLGERPGRSIPTGLVDLLGCIPVTVLLNLGFGRWAGIVRLLRADRLRRVNRVVEGRRPRALLAAFVRSRAEAAAYVVVLAVLLVIVVGSSLIALVEVPNPDSNINSAGDAVWWTFVTITTVGYGDKYPITEAGRIVGVITMAVGIAIFGVLTSFLAKLFLEDPDDRRGPASTTPDEQPVTTPGEPAQVTRSVVATPPSDTTAEELRAIREELADLRRAVEDRPA
jgi:voltage-gated potassium channel Kch